ncbi:MAG: hypothetical protein LBQ20_03695 [Rhodanobacter sp.]|jgi:hypothetical protein|nr:hypothetical protein [Rhodanobacter sp.]
MFKSFLPLIAALLIALVVSACGKSAVDAPVAQNSPDISGKLNESSYKQAAEKTLAEVPSAIADRALTEDRLDTDAAAIKVLMTQSDKLNVDRAKLSEVGLMSALGALYSRKRWHSISTVRSRPAPIRPKGSIISNRAVSKYPDNITARLNCGMTAARVPEFMGKREVARDDQRLATNNLRFAELSLDLQTSARETLAEVEWQLTQQGGQPQMRAILTADV